MSRFTIVYTDGYEEHYVIVHQKEVDPGMQVQHIKKLIEDDTLKLIIEDDQFALIPIANIRKLIFQPEGDISVGAHDMPGILNVKVVEP